MSVLSGSVVVLSILEHQNIKKLKKNNKLLVTELSCLGHIWLTETAELVE